MSDLIRTTNMIKAKRHISWLTSSQRQAWEALRGLLCVPNTVNLYGSAGTGKTFLAWNLADEWGYVYFPHLTLFEQTEHLDAPGVIIDNMEASHQVHRDVLKLLIFRQVRYAVLVTRQVIQDYTHCVELTLTPEDQAQVRENLAGIGIFRPAVDLPNLWPLINPALGEWCDA